MRAVGSAFEHGRLGFAKDVGKALEWFRKAAEVRCPVTLCEPLVIGQQAGNARAMNDLGICYEDGIGVDKSLSDAAAWFAKASERGISCFFFVVVF